MNWLILPQVEKSLLLLLFLLLLLLLFYCCCFCCFYCCYCCCFIVVVFVVFIVFIVAVDIVVNRTSYSVKVGSLVLTFTVPLILINTLGEMLTHIVERGAMFSQLDYINLLQLINRQDSFILIHLFIHSFIRSSCQSFFYLFILLFIFLFIHLVTNNYLLNIY